MKDAYKIRAPRTRIRYRQHPRMYRRAYTHEEKAGLLEDFARLRKRHNVSECAAILQLSEATIYRWQREAEDKETRSASKPDDLEKTNTAIKTLCCGRACGSWELLHSVFRFAAWLRWPLSCQYHDISVVSCIAAYLRQTTSVDRVSDLADEAKSLLNANLSLTTLARLCSDELVWDTPRWKPFDKYLDPVPNDERDLLAEIVWSIIAIGKNQKSHRLSGSLSKAFFLIKHRLLRSSIVAPGMIHKWWRENAPAAPFLYVERYHSGLDWRLDPTSEDFASQVDSIKSNRAALLKFFRNSKFANDTFTEILGSRASRNMLAPKFPEGLEAEMVRTPDLSRAIVEALKTYKS